MDTRLLSKSISLALNWGLPLATAAVLATVDVRTGNRAASAPAGQQVACLSAAVVLTTWRRGWNVS